MNVSLLRIRATNGDELAFKVPVSVGRYPVSAMAAIGGVLALTVAAPAGVS